MEVEEAKEGEKKEGEKMEVEGEIGEEGWGTYELTGVLTHQVSCLPPPALDRPSTAKGY